MYSDCEEMFTLYQTTKLQVKTFPDNIMNVNQKLKFDLGKVRKHCEEKKKMLVTSILSFFHNIFKRFFS